MLKKILPIVIVLFSISCTSQEKETPKTTDIIPSTSINYLALGDSYTIGQGVEVEQRWPEQLSDSLTNKGYKISITDIIATTGWTTRDLLNAIDNTELKEYNLVSLLIGVNNQYQNQAFNLFQSEFDELINKSVQIAGDKQRVFVVSIPDYGVTPFGSANSEKIGLELDKYNAYMSDKCEALDIPFINITPISRMLGDTPGSLASDNLHPSGSQYTEWVKEILPVVIKILNK